jgi:uncharacterized protein YcaQ
MAKKASGTIYPLSALRAMALHTQFLTTPNGASPTPDAIVDLVTALGYVQIDTLYVVNRAHDVTLWARFGSYDTGDFHKLIYAAGQRRLYEGWGHAASIITLEHYRYHRWRIFSGYSEWLDKNGNRELADQILERIRSEGRCAWGTWSTKAQSAARGITGSPPRWRWKRCSPTAI